MTSQTSFRSSWAEMSKPPSPDALTVKPVRGTNAFLTKDHCIFRAFFEGSTRRLA